MTGQQAPTSAAVPDWVDALQRPAAYSFAVDAVELRETHISWLFFAGDRVFKAKKPLDLGFLDYSTPERRQGFCEAEVRLNRRLAPDAYLGVEPIVERADGRITLGGPGRVLDWAVAMRRLPAERMLDRLLAQGEAQPELFDKLAHLLARFHRSAATSAAIARHGRPAAVAHNLLENFEQTQAAVGDLLPASQHGALQAWTRRELQRLEALLAARVREDRIRDGHGDLHAGNVCLTDVGIVIYDCIEFSDALRCADVACDLAFLVMDLQHAGEWMLARRLVREYARTAGDGQLHELMPLYCSYRAMVRAKVAVIRHAQLDAGDARTEQARLARGYFDLAAVYALGPVLILSCGLPGSGKSWAARHLARATGATVLSSDRIRREQRGAVADAGRSETYGRGRYTLAARQLIYDELVRRTAAALGRGDSVIVDASLSRARWREPFLKAAAAAGCACLVLERQASDADVKARMERRRQAGDSDSEADFAVYQAAKKDFEAPDEVPTALRLSLDARAQPDTLRARVIERLVSLSVPAQR